MKNWNECDEALKKVALIDIAVQEADAARNQALLDAETEYKRATAPELARREVLVGELEAFYRKNRKEAEAGGKRSIELNFGRLGMRLGKPKLSLAKGWKWERVLAAIKDRWGRNGELLKALVNTKETVNKDGCKGRLKTEELAEIGLKIKQGDEFFYETFPDKVSAQAA